MSAADDHPHVHVIGAGLAGLSAAARLADQGRQVTLYEAAAQAGGRCRSFQDAKLGRLIDNGNHLMMTANTALLSYLALIEAGDVLTKPSEAAFPFLDLESGRSWILRPNRGVIPWWILDPRRRIPGTGLRSYLKGLRLAWAGQDTRVTNCIDKHDPLWRCFWEPLVVAVLNTPGEEASAQLLWHVVTETFAKGEAACRPLVAREGLGPALVEPALAFLQRHGVGLRFNQRLRHIDFGDQRVRGLAFTKDAISLGHQDKVVLALPPSAVQALLPDVTLPLESHAIVNAHIRLPKAPAWTFGPQSEVPFLGLLGGTADWLFLRDDVASLTVSAATALAERPNEEIAQRLWADTARVFGLDVAQRPEIRVINEKRATLAQTPSALRLRPSSRTAWRNLVLAGDWTDTGLPATIESAVRSGEAAAKALTLP